MDSSGTMIFTPGKLFVKKGFKIYVPMFKKIHIRSPYIIANFNFIIKPYIIVMYENLISFSKLKIIKKE